MLACLTYGAVFVSFPDRAGAFDMIYTVQAGCHENLGAAQQHYYDLVNTLESENLDFLRIEEIGRSYCVRIGKFKESDRAHEFHQSIKTRMRSSMVMQAYVLDERVRKMFFQPPKADPAEPGTPLSSARRSGEAETEQTMSAAGQGHAQSVHEQRGDMYVKEKRLLSAAEEYRLAIIEVPGSAELMWKLAELYYELQLTDDAFRFMERAIGLSPGRAVAWRKRLGMLYYQSGIPDRAAEQFTMLLSMNLEAPGINYYLGRIYLSQNRLDSAREQFIEALTMDPGSAAAHYYLGRTYFQKKNYLTAWKAALTAQRLGYEDEDLINELQKLSQKPDVSWESNGEELLIREIIVQSRDRAEDIIFRLSQGEHFENIVSNELGEPGKALEYRNPTEMDPKVADISQKLEIFSVPVIVETETGFHIVQRIPSITVYAYE